MKTGKKIRQLLSFVLILLVGVQMVFPVFAAENTSETETETDEIIYIKSADDLISLAEQCTLDTWSVGKTVVLENDIDLEKSEFVPIASFGGTFDGNGHSVTGVNITGSYSPTGFFGVLQETAVVKDVNISGSVRPDGTADMVGGIAGRNEGIISNCSFYGYVTGSDSVGGIAGVNEAKGEIRRCQSSAAVVGSHSSGGIAGTNHGAVNNCKNTGDINTSLADVTKSLSDISIDSIKDLNNTSNSAAHMDTGGIAGLSDGKIYYCSNSGSVGYPHVGYNVGGIAGRVQQGYLQSCTNTGHIQGRKDVGGITGQLEPFLEIQYLNGKLEELEQETERFFDLADAAASDLNSYGKQASSLINGISSDLKTANAAANNVSASGNQLWSFYNQELGEVNDELKQYNTEYNESKKNNDSDSDTATEIGSNAGEQNQGNITFNPNNITIDPDNPGDITIDTGAYEIPELESTKEYEDTMHEILENTSGHLSDTLDASRNQGSIVADNMKQMNASMDSAGSSLESLSDVLMEGGEKTNKNIEALSDQTKVLKNLIEEIRDDLFRTEGITVNDVSETDISYDATTFQKGKITLCTNNGLVEADLNVAGVTGQIGTEYDIDPESDISISGTETLEAEHVVNAVVRNSKNYGEIIAKKDYAGGIVGKTDIGAIILCEDYGTITSTGGSYVGGIAGSCGGTIRECYVKTTLSGKNYVGGIVGSGKNGDDEDEEGSSIVLGCYSIVDIEEGEQYTGAIAGIEKGIFRSNYFVSDALAGINHISSMGKAEPVSYETMRQTEGLPQEFGEFTLEFIADDTVIRSLTFSYGDSLDKNVFPEIPEKDGYYARWDRTDLKNLCFDTTVTAEYFQYVTALQSKDERSDERPVFFVEGQFKDGDKLSVSRQENKESTQNTILESEGLLEKINRQEVLEQWSIEMPEDGLDSHTIRYLASEEKRNHLEIFVSDSGKWTKVSTNEIGSYLLFDVTGDSVEIAILSSRPIWWIRILAVAVVAVILFGMIKIIRKCRKSGKKKSEKAGTKNMTETVSTETTEKDEKKKGKKKRKWWIPVLIFVCIVIGMIAGVIVFAGRKAANAVDAYKLLQEYEQQQEFSMELSIEAEIGNEQLDKKRNIVRTEAANEKITCIEEDGMTLYYADEMIFLENGKAFQTSELFPDYSKLLEQTLQLYQSVDIKVSDSGEGKQYRFTTKQDGAKELTELLLPDIAGELSETQTINVTLTVENDKLTEIEFLADASLNDSEKTSVTIHADAILSDQVSQETMVPQELVEIISEKKYKAEDILTEDLFELAFAWSNLNGQETVGQKLLLTADCGTLTVNDELLLIKKVENDVAINCVRKNDQSLYFTDYKICDQNGKTMLETQNSLVKSARLPEIVYKLCLNGNLSCTETTGEYIYTLVLEEDGMKALAYAIAPEAADLDIVFDTGSIQIMVKDEQIKKMQIVCEGNVDLLLVETPVSFSAELNFDESNVPEGFSVPDAVIKTLTDTKEK